MLPLFHNNYRTHILGIFIAKKILGTTYKKVFYGKVLNKNKKKLINNMFIICKKYIYVTKLLSTKLNLHEAMQLAKEVMEIE